MRIVNILLGVAVIVLGLGATKCTGDPNKDAITAFSCDPDWDEHDGPVAQLAIHGGWSPELGNSVMWLEYEEFYRNAGDGKIKGEWRDENGNIGTISGGVCYDKIIGHVDWGDGDIMDFEGSMDHESNLVLNYTIQDTGETFTQARSQPSLRGASPHTRSTPTG